jgi:hypothetical protein
MQNALIQDGALDSSLARVATNMRLLEIDLASGAFREFLYVLDDKSYGVNEIVAINATQFLVIERDGKAGSSAAFKKIMKIDIGGATNIHDLKALPATGLPPGVTPVAKSVFIDLLDPAHGLAGASFPEKIEGLAFGAPLANGDYTLYVASDNDFKASQPSNFYVFGIPPADLPGYAAQASNCEEPPPQTVTLSQLQTEVFDLECAGCHTGGGTSLPASMNLSSVEATYANLVNVPSKQVPSLLRVEPLDPDNSYLITKLVGGPQMGGARMPFGGAPLPTETVERIKTWIREGARP